MTRHIIFINGTIVTAGGSFLADLEVEGEKIIRVGEALEWDGAERIDCSGRLLLPGGVDPHTHFDLPMFGTVSSDDHYTGHKAAVFGGTTTVLDFVPQDSEDLVACVAAWRRKAEKAAIDYGFHMNITSYNERVAAQIPGLKELGISTLKVFMAYNDRLRLQDGEIFDVMRIANERGMLVMLHAENGDVIERLVADALQSGNTSPEWHARTRPAWSGVEAVLRGCALAAEAGSALYVVHMNSSGEVDMLHYAREHGVRAMGETCPQYLMFTDEVLRRPDGARWVCSPPVRLDGDRGALWDGLSAGVLQVLGTDHCPFFFDGSQPIAYEGRAIAIAGKELGRDDFTKIPNGLPMIGDRLPIFWTYGVGAGRISPEQFVALTSTNASRIFGLYPRKGALEPGSDADITIWDPYKRLRYGKAVARHRTDYNLFEGVELLGFPSAVYLRGRCLVSNGEWLGESGYGRFLPRKTYEFL